MRTAPIDEVEQGMVLAQDAKTGDGRMLLPAGFTLEQKHIQLLEQQGVATVTVQDEEDEAMLEQAVGYARRFFEFADHNHEAVDAMFRLSVERLNRRLGQGWTPPTEDELLARSVEHLRDLFFKGEGTAEDIIAAEVELVSFPDVYFKIKEILDSPGSTAEAVAAVVSKDVGLTAKLLKLVNSPMYGFAGGVSSVSRAVSLLGAKELSTLALGISTINFFKDIPPELVDVKSFWKHSISCGILAKLLAERIPDLSKERFFTAGLLHDVGKLIIYKKMPYASVQVLLYARSNSAPVVEAENDILGFDHAEVGRLLLSEWNFPEDLVNMVGRHHSPMQSPAPREAAVVHIANILANALEIAAGGMFCLQGVIPGAWELLGLEVQDLEQTVVEYDEQIEEILSTFLH